MPIEIDNYATIVKPGPEQGWFTVTLGNPPWRNPVPDLFVNDEVVFAQTRFVVQMIEGKTLTLRPKLRGN